MPVSLLNRASGAVKRVICCGAGPHLVGSCDPYLCLDVGPTRRLRSSFCNNTHNPVWNERARVYVADEAEELRLQVKVPDTEDITSSNGRWLVDCSNQELIFSSIVPEPIKAYQQMLRSIVPQPITPNQQSAAAALLESGIPAAKSVNFKAVLPKKASLCPQSYVCDIFCHDLCRMLMLWVLKSWVRPPCL